MNTPVDIGEARYRKMLDDLRRDIESDDIEPRQRADAQSVLLLAKVTDHIGELYRKIDDLQALVEDCATRSDLDDLRAELLGMTRERS